MYLHENRKRKHSATKPLFYLVFFGAVIGGGMWGFKHVSYAFGSVQTKLAGAQEVAVVPEADTTELAATVQQIVSENSGMDIGVAIIDLQTGKNYVYGETASFDAASIGKLLTATLFLSQVQDGKASLTDTIGGKTAGEQLKLLITVSDNTAWHALNDELTHASLQSYADGLGLTTYNAENNTITPKDISKLLAKLYQKELLNTKYTNLLLSYMKQANNTQYIPTAAPDTATVYHKAGWLSDRVHDAAIVHDGNKAYVLVIFTKSKTAAYSTATGLDIFHTITAVANKTFL